jgi:hypothetical protein
MHHHFDRKTARHGEQPLGVQHYELPPPRPGLRLVELERARDRAEPKP